LSCTMHLAPLQVCLKQTAAKNAKTIQINVDAFML